MTLNFEFKKQKKVIVQESKLKDFNVTEKKKVLKNVKGLVIPIPSKRPKLTDLTISKNDYDYKVDLDSRPNVDENDYDEVPVEEFGLAMMRGMGWKDGQKGTQVKEVVFRPKGIGLEADKRMKGRLLETEIEKGTCCSIIIKNQPFVAKVVGFDEENTRVMLELKHNKAIVNFSQFSLKVISQTQYDQFNVETKSSTNEENKNNENKRKIKDWKDNEENGSDVVEVGSSPCLISWLHQNLIVRIIDKNYRKKKYYKEKVVVLDVTSPVTCVCRTFSGELLEDLSQDMLETVVPKKEGREIMIVTGEFKFKKGQVINLKKNKNRALVQLSGDEESLLINLNYDQICSFQE